MANGKAVRDARGSRTQTQMALELDDLVTRETLSAYETGRAKVAPDISRRITKISQDAWYILKVFREFTGIGPRKPDGARAADHPSSWKEILIRELEEAIVSLKGIDLSVPLKVQTNWEIDEHRRCCQQVMDAANASLKYLSTVDENAPQINMYEEWQINHDKHVSRGYYAKED